jgi:preprotein translocase subunit SecD
LVIQLNAGSLPVPVNLVQESAVGATLGSQSVKESLIAGIVGITMVCLFMIN